MTGLGRLSIDDPRLAPYVGMYAAVVDPATCDGLSRRVIRVSLGTRYASRFRGPL